ncbi:MAG: ABC transporter ATP-binding protein [Pseudobdellovibrionaceae bacterium]
MNSALIKRIIGELWPYRVRLLVVAFCGILTSAATGQVVVLIQRLPDALGSKDINKMYVICGLVLGAALGAGITRYFHFYGMKYITEIVTQKLRSRLQQKYMRLNWLYQMEHSSSGALLSRMMNDINIIQQYLSLFADFFREPLLLLFLLGWLFHLNWKLTLSIVFLLPLLVFILKNLARAVAKYSQRAQQAFEKLVSVVKETLDGLRVIQAFNLQKWMSSKFDQEFKDYLEAKLKVHSRMEFAGPLTELIATTLILGILLYMSVEISHGRATYGDFASYIATLLIINKPLKVLQDSFVKLQELFVAFRRTYEILDDPREFADLYQGQAFPSAWQNLTYKNIYFQYHDSPILKNINFTLQRGEVLALVGASGSGKSTIVNLLERFLEPSAGQIYIDQTPFSQISLYELRKNLALVTQDVFLFNDSVANNILSGKADLDDLLAAHPGDLQLSEHDEKNMRLVQDKARQAFAEDFILQKAGGYGAKSGERGGSFSGGEKQRLSIARAMLREAAILILDEATSALDSVSEQEVQKALDVLLKNRTAIVIAHRLSTIMKADRILVMRDGEIVEQGSHADLLSLRGEYFKLYELQRF